VAEPIAGSGQVQPSTLPGGTVATTVHVGSYLELGAAYSALEEWLGANGFVPAGHPWETYLDAPEVDEPRTLVSAPCRKA
jgi:effector-binding domain-containing protein